jgi:WD40 repeat protein
MENGKLDNVKLACKAHKSEIAVMCGEYNCDTTTLCIKCISESNCCTRNKNHKSVSFTEFVDKFFNEQIDTLKNDFTHSNEMLNSFNYLNNADDVKMKFRAKLEEINGTVNKIYNNMMNKITSLFEDFNKDFLKLASEKEKQLHEALEKLNLEFNYTYLGDYNQNKFIHKLCRMPIESFNNSISTIKNTLNNLKKKDYFKYEEQVSSIINLNNELTRKYEKSFAELELEFEKRHNIFKNSLNDELFLTVEDIKAPLESYRLNYESYIDYSSNSNLLDKKFLVFKHSNKNTLLAYPTSQNTIKLEYFDKLLTNQMYKLNISHNVRNDYLYFNLQYHGGKILDLKYYRNNDTDYLISSSEDKTIKIWNISNLNKYLTNVNEFYRNNCVKTILAHDNRISTFILYNNTISNSESHLIISVGSADKIKVWDLPTGNLIREFETLINMDNILHAYLDTDKRTNILISANNNYSIRVWNLDKGSLLYTIKYPTSKIVSIESLEDSYGGWLIFDENSKCAYIDTSYNMFPTEIDNFHTTRIGTIKWDKKTIYIYNKNGMIYEYDINSKSITSRLRISEKQISFAMKYHHTLKKLLVVHTIDQKFKILST